ncbi:condensation domain-containing protein, partial [Nocardia puris]|uniref:condensation domain-containing protein n=1 Tax=Nocardia puris TaxID=208602 RepID=UPI001E2C1CCC
AALAAKVESATGQGGRAPLTAQERPAPVPLPDGQTAQLVPLSPAQQRMWFLNRFDPTETVHNIPVAIRFTGELDRAALTAAVAAVVDRHETLRTRYPDRDGIGHQQILPPGR